MPRAAAIEKIIHVGSVAAGDLGLFFAGPRTASSVGRIALLVATYLTLPAVLAASDLVATVLRRTARQIAAMADLQIMPLARDLAVTVSMAWHRRTTSEPAQIWFRSLLTEAARD